MTSLSAEKPHDMIIGRAKRGQISRTDSEFFNGIGQQLPVTRSGRLSWLQSVAGIGAAPWKTYYLRHRNNKHGGWNEHQLCKKSPGQPTA